MMVTDTRTPENYLHRDHWTRERRNEERKKVKEREGELHTKCDSTCMSTFRHRLSRERDRLV